MTSTRAVAQPPSGARTTGAAQSAEDAHYRIEPVPTPADVVLEVGGMGFEPGGSLLVATRRGEIWRYEPQASKRRSASAARGGWSLFADGLHEPLGLLVVGPGEVVVAQRPELTRVRDVDRDGMADRYETLTAAWGVSGNYHEYAFGPVRDREGNLYGTLNVGWTSRGVSLVPYRGWAYKLTPAGEFVPFALGFRSPAGIGISPEGDVFVTDNQGDWVATSPLMHVTKGAFFNHPASLRWEPGYQGPDEANDLPIDRFETRRKLPAAWLTYGADGHSPTEPIWDTTNGRFGPFAGQMLIGDQTKSIITRVALEKVGGEWQGATIRFRRGFSSGITRMTFGSDGALWVGGTDRGWGAIGGRPFALERLVFTGEPPFEILRVRAKRDGFELELTKPVDPSSARGERAFTISHHGLRYWSTYGSPHVGTTSVAPRNVVVSSDGLRVTLELPELVRGRVYELDAQGLRARAGGAPLLHSVARYTLNRIPE